ncbi:hypothetical protein RCL_jg23746.t1 [Rhizophagus clarus]|uniref:Uncharacterized protein n=1 Tax=Rhizophagus clarus TaxID=94130 RepID=A0A8H3QSM1_9GLOM|nr:hypothetical protein RCL_jg23746.t1 [Rhizophagus clarus]
MPVENQQEKSRYNYLLSLVNHKFIWSTQKAIEEVDQLNLEVKNVIFLAVSKKRYFLGKFAEPSNKGKSDNISKGTREPYFIKKQCVGIVA